MIKNLIMTRISSSFKQFPIINLMPIIHRGIKPTTKRKITTHPISPLKRKIGTDTIETKDKREKTKPNLKNKLTKNRFTIRTASENQNFKMSSK
jgi:hypothetical protein